VELSAHYAQLGRSNQEFSYNAAEMPRVVAIFVRLVIAVGIALLVFYAADSLILRLRTNQTSTVTVRPYLAVPEKGSKIEFMFQEPRPQACVNALFPHLGLTPCWYLRRNTEQRTNL
jgi:hypothetical protein